MQINNQTAAGNYQTIPLLFLSSEVFGKAVKKILEENSKPTASSWYLLFLYEFYWKKKKTQNTDFMINLDEFKWACQDLDQETTGILQTLTKIGASNLFCPSVQGICLDEWGSGGLDEWCQLWKGTSPGALFCLDVSAYVYAHSCVTAKSVT